MSEEKIRHIIEVFENDYCEKCSEFNCLEGSMEEIITAMKQLQQENKQLKNNWNKLKEFIEKDYDFYDKLIAPEYGCSMGALSRIKDKMQELEQGSDYNVKDKR